MAEVVSLDVAISSQVLTVFKDGQPLKSYPVSTSINGAGEKKGSECTPTGWHSIRAKIGSGLPLDAVLVGRRPTGEIYNGELAKRFPQRDWILSRILWLGGLERGKNRYGEVDTFWRYIYIHGTPDEHLVGQPVSHGCIRMKKNHLLELFDRVEPGTKVYIHL